VRGKGNRKKTSSAAELDHYQLLQIDPDAPQDLVIEAYWYIADKLRAQAAIKGVEKELEALNAAYADLVVPERRRAYDSAVARVEQLRRSRAASGPSRRRAPLFGRKRHADRRQDYYAMLAIDPRAEPPVIARAYSIVRTLERNGGGTEPSYRTGELQEALSVLLDGRRRAAYDERLYGKSIPAGATPGPAKKHAAGIDTAAGDGAAAEDAGRAAGLSSLRPLGRALAHGGRILWLSLVFIVSQLARLGLFLGKWAARAAGALAVFVRDAISDWKARREGDKGYSGFPDRRVLADLPAVRKMTAADIEAPLRQARLLVEDGRGEARVVTLGNGPLTIGAGPDCDVTLPMEDSAVASEHAQIRLTGGHFVIRSLSPAHPTLIDGSNVNWAMLDDGDEIEIGRWRIRFEVLSTAAPPADPQVGPDGGTTLPEEETGKA
jgi:hypothetical protein